ncbi:MAG: hypothetical protein LBM02_04645 [Lachnospiraceae bacterium]|jgi:hypothetical protein|nr:hypothetical protein [Lachnospiraceae bacterium]
MEKITTNIFKLTGEKNVRINTRIEKNRAEYVTGTPIKPSSLPAVTALK